MGIALTFDDGPNHTTTLELLEFLEEQRVTATFFVLGDMVRKFPSVLKRIASSPLGHQIGNHSWSHRDFKTLDDDAIQEEINKTQKIVEDTIGASLIRIMRPPYGSATPAQKALIRGMGYEVVLWNLNSNDTTKGFPRKAGPIAKQVLDHVHEGNIVLVHDIHAYSVGAMKIAIPALKRKKFSFVTVRHLRSETAAAAASTN